jgi:hypothetical protein
MMGRSGFVKSLLSEAKTVTFADWFQRGLMSSEGTAESFGAAGPSVDECFDVLEALFGAAVEK